MKHQRTWNTLLIVFALSFGTALAAVPPAEVWVDDSWTGPGDCGGHVWGLDAFNRIAEAVDVVATNGAVYVASGTYAEQVAITTDGIRVIGQGTPGAPTKITAPVTKSYRLFTGPVANWPVIAVEDARGVSIWNVTVDGLDRGSEMGRFVGIAFWNADGLVSDCTITGMRHVPMSGQYSGTGIYAGNDGGGPYELSILQTTVDHYQADGMFLTGRGTSFIVTGCTVVGSGQISEIGQTGIEIADGASGRITDCHSSNHGYIGHDGLTGIGYRVDNCGGPIEFGWGCTSTDDQIGFFFRNSDGAIREAVISNLGDSRNGIIIHNTRIPRQATGGFSPMGESPVGTESHPMRVQVTGCDIGGHGVSGVQILSDGGVLETELIGNKIHNWEGGVLVDGPGNPFIHAYGNRFYENTYFHALDNGASPPNLWNYTSEGGPGNYWEDYDGTGPHAITGEAGSVDHSPNPTVVFGIASSTPLLSCSESAVLNVTVGPVACMRSYDLLFEYDATRWSAPTFSNVLPVGAQSGGQAQYSAYAVGTGRYRITHAIQGPTLGFGSPNSVEIFRINLVPKANAAQGSSSFALGTQYGSVEYPIVSDTFNEEIASVIGTSRADASVDCTPPTVNLIVASGDQRAGAVPDVNVSGQEGPANGGHVTRLWYQFQTEGHACSNAPANWTELAEVSLPSGPWSGGQIFRPATVPDFIGPCTMYVMAEDEAGNKGFCTGASTINFNYGPADDADNGHGPTEGSTTPGRYDLGEAAPNPFDSHTFLPFALPTPTHVMIVVFDLSGRVVRTVVDETFPAGWHTAEWDGLDDAGRVLSRGVYFYSMSAGPYRSHKKVLLID